MASARTHMMPPPLRVGSTEDGSAANVHKKRCNESRSSAEGGWDPLPLLSARQAFLHAHRRCLCFMGAPFRYQCNSCGIVESALSSCSGVDIVLTRCDRPLLKLDHRCEGVGRRGAKWIEHLPPAAKEPVQWRRRQRRGRGHLPPSPCSRCSSSPLESGTRWAQKQIEFVPFPLSSLSLAPAWHLLPPFSPSLPSSSS